MVRYITEILFSVAGKLGFINALLRPRGKRWTVVMYGYRPPNSPADVFLPIRVPYVSEKLLTESRILEEDAGPKRGLNQLIYVVKRQSWVDSE